jgi:hypothetical protein
MYNISRLAELPAGSDCEGGRRERQCSEPYTVEMTHSEFERWLQDFVNARQNMYLEH